MLLLTTDFTEKSDLKQFEAINLVEIPKMEYPKLKNRRHFRKDI